jgi:hypothetical protein
MWGRKCFEHILAFFFGSHASPLPTARIQSFEKWCGKEKDMFASLELELQDFNTQYIGAISHRTQLQTMYLFCRPLYSEYSTNMKSINHIY